MKDGHVNKCKECNKSDVVNNRALNISYYREYDKKRGNRQNKQYRDEYKAKYPNKYRAHTITSNAIRDGKLFKEPCEICSEVNAVHAHHDDYAKPLNVRWLCAAHHSQWHKKNGEGLNVK
jgi:hypothetical protein